MKWLISSQSVRRRQAGQSLVEVAISLPFLLMLCLGTVDITRAFYYREAVLNSARQALRESVSPTAQSTGDSACASGGTLTSPVPPAGGPLASIANAVALESSVDATPAGSSLQGATLTVSWHCSGSTAVTNPGATATDPSNSGSAAVQVKVAYTMPLITPFISNLLGRSGIQLGATVVGRAEY